MLYHTLTWWDPELPLALSHTGLVPSLLHCPCLTQPCSGSVVIDLGHQRQHKSASWQPLWVSGGEKRVKLDQEGLLAVRNAIKAILRWQRRFHFSGRSSLKFNSFAHRISFFLTPMVAPSPATTCNLLSSTSMCVTRTTYRAPNGASGAAKRGAS